LQLVKKFPAFYGTRRFWWGNLRKRDHLGDPDVDGRIIIRWLLKK
jgi:hypothetical protein